VFVLPGSRVDSSYYCDIVLNHGLLPDIHKLSGNNFTFQQYGARQLIVHNKQLRFCVFMCQNLCNQKIGRRIAQIKTQWTRAIRSGEHSVLVAFETLSKPAGSRLVKTSSVAQYIGQFRKRLSLVVATGGRQIKHRFDYCFWCYTYVIILTCFVVEIQNLDNESK